MIRAIIIDDEKNNIESLQGLLKEYCPAVQVIGQALNASDGQSLILTEHPDLVFLDIQMPDKNGFDLLRSLPDHSFELIFVTAFDEYGIQAVKFSAIDYLLKPVNIAELKDAVAKVTEKNRQKQQNKQLENLLNLLKNQESKEEHRLALSTAKETRFVNPKQIIRCESSNTYTSFFLAGGEKILVSNPIYEYEELLSKYGFIRCHQSHLLNTRYISSWVKEDGGYLLLEDKSTIPVSRNKKDAVLKAIDIRRRET